MAVSDQLVPPILQGYCRDAVAAFAVTCLTSIISAARFSPSIAERLKS